MTLLWGHSSGTLGTLLWRALVVLWDTVAGRSRGTLLRDTLVGHSCGTLW